MSRRDKPRSRGGFWRIAAICVAVALGASAVYLVAFSTSAKQSSIGILLGAWAVFLAAPVIFGGRRAQQQAALQREAALHAATLQEAHEQIARLHDAQLQAVREVRASQELELRRFGEVQLAREVAARREADFRLEIALRGEVERILSEHLGSLREEVASLRAEVVDKLGGQLRLERIETTRVIASDLEALQNEIRRLGGSQESLAAPQHFARTSSAPSGPVAGGQPTPWGSQAPKLDVDPQAGRAGTEPARSAGPQSGRANVTAAPDTDDIVDAEVVEVETFEARLAQPEVVEQESARSAQAPATPSPSPAPPPAAPVTPAPTPASSPPAEPPRMRRDPFADLPRLTPLPDELADLLDPPLAASGPLAANSTVNDAKDSAEEIAADERARDLKDVSAAKAAKDVKDAKEAKDVKDAKDRKSGKRRAPDPEVVLAEDPKYVGRRRAAGFDSGSDAAESAPSADDEKPDEPAGATASGRRRAPDDAPDDLMSRLHQL